MPLLNLDYLSLFDWVWSTSAKVSVLIVLLLLVKVVLRDKIGARLHYLLWFVVIISLLVPWTPQSSFSLYNITNIHTSPVMKTGTKTASVSAITDTGNSNETIATRLEKSSVIQNYGKLPKANASPNPKESTLISVVTSSFTHRLLFYIWLIGIAVFIVANGLVNLRFIRGIKGDPVVEPKLLTAFYEAKNKFNIKTDIPLIQTSLITSPSLYGVFSPRLLIPLGILEEFSSEQLNHVFVHELLHFKRKDIWVNWLAQGLLVVHWFNPLLWYGFYNLREDQEIACDALTLKHIGMKDPKEYAYTLIKLVENNSRITEIASLASLSGSNSQIKRRITMLKNFPRVQFKWVVLVITVVVALAFVTLTNAKADTPSAVGTSNTNSSSMVAGTGATATNVVPSRQTPQSNQSSSASGGIQTVQPNQSSSAPEGSFDYHNYLPFTPLLPSYTAGQKLTYSKIDSSLNNPQGNTIIYTARYGSPGGSMFVIMEGRPDEFHLATNSTAKTPIQIGDLQASMEKSRSGVSIQFAKNNVEYNVTSSGGNFTLDDLQKISESITVPAVKAPTEINLENTGLSSLNGLSFKSIRPGDFLIPQGYKLQGVSTNINISADKKVELVTMTYKNGASYLSIYENNGNLYGDSTGSSGFDTKQIGGTIVKMRNSSNTMLPAAEFTLSRNGLQFAIFSDLPQSEVDKVVTSILQGS
ncbi:regulatory protein BlaR1 [Peptococcaceae bacterium CEB3]|nr:regulatory protein BlaR1 [Peptococcaceae bacterium CEB3]